MPGCSHVVFMHLQKPVWQGGRSVLNQSALPIIPGINREEEGMPVTLRMIGTAVNVVQCSNLLYRTTMAYILPMDNSKKIGQEIMDLYAFLAIF